MKTRHTLAALCAAALLSVPAGAADILTYAEKDGTIKVAQVDRVTKEDEKELDCRVLVGGRPRRMQVPSRRVVEFRRGDPDAVSQWSKRLATGKRLLASGQLATQSNPPVPGAEETFAKIAYTTEKGIAGDEAAYEALPWHNEYALFYLIETRYQMGLKGDKVKLEAALANVQEFKDRSTNKKTIDMEVPGEQGSRKVKVYCWGDSRLMPDVLLLEGKILAAMGEKDKAKAAFDALIEKAKKGGYPPAILTGAFMAKADLEAEGQPSEAQEALYRGAGSMLASLARNEPDEFGKMVLTREANRALLKGANLLRDSAAESKVPWDTPLNRYEQLKAGEGQRDPALYMGAQAGIGICLTERGRGQEAYDALLEVVVKGHEYPEQMAAALYYLGKASKLFADEVDAKGGKGDFLRAESARWWQDLKERFPTSRWAEKVQEK